MNSLAPVAHRVVVSRQFIIFKRISVGLAGDTGKSMVTRALVFMWISGYSQGDESAYLHFATIRVQYNCVVKKPIDALQKCVIPLSILLLKEAHTMAPISPMG